MGPSIRTGFGLCSAFALAIFVPSPALAAGKTVEPGSEQRSDAEYVKSGSDCVGGPHTRLAIRIVDPEDPDQVGIIVFETPRCGGELSVPTGGPH